MSCQVFTGAIPFHGSSSNRIVVSILQGKRPERPEHPSFTDELWSLVQRCWDDAPHSRPPTSEVLGTLEVLTWRRLASDTPINPAVAERVKTDENSCRFPFFRLVGIEVFTFNS